MPRALDKVTGRLQLMARAKQALLSLSAVPKNSASHCCVLCRHVSLEVSGFILTITNITNTVHDRTTSAEA